MRRGEIFYSPFRFPLLPLDLDYRAITRLLRADGNMKWTENLFNAVILTTLEAYLRYTYNNEQKISRKQNHSNTVTSNGSQSENMGMAPENHDSGSKISSEKLTNRLGRTSN